VGAKKTPLQQGGPPVEKPAGKKRGWCFLQMAAASGRPNNYMSKDVAKLTDAEFAKKIGISERTFFRWKHSEGFPVGYDVAAVWEWAEQHGLGRTLGARATLVRPARERDREEEISIEFAASAAAKGSFAPVLGFLRDRYLREAAKMLSLVRHILRDHPDIVAKADAAFDREVVKLPHAFRALLREAGRLDALPGAHPSAPEPRKTRTHTRA
jgi:hypothetical protein